MADPEHPKVSLSESDRKWLHDKYERLASEEGQLAASRTSYFAAIGAVLVTGFVVAVANLGGHPLILGAVITFLAALGILISLVWTLLLNRTTDAQNLWREAALRLEREAPPLEGHLRAVIAVRSGREITIDLLRPYEAHRERFSRAGPISWMDRVNPGALTELLPLAFLVIWIAILLVGWLWIVGLT